MAHPYRSKTQGAARAKALTRAEGGAAMDRARAELSSRMAKDHAARSEMTMIERDRDDATKHAFRSGDYAPQGNWASKLGYSYKPWNPKRGD